MTQKLTDLEAKMAKAKAKRARADDEIARIKAKQRNLETGQKIIIGALILDEARKSDGMRGPLLRRLKEITRDQDKKRIAPLIAELEEIDRQEKGTQGPSQSPFTQNGAGPR